MEFKEVTKNIANMFFSNIGMDKPADKGFANFVRVDNKKNSTCLKDEQASAVSETPKKDIVRKDVDVSKNSKSEKVETVDNKKIDLVEVVEETAVEEVALEEGTVDIIDIIVPEDSAKEEEDSLAEVVYIEPIILEDSLTSAPFIDNQTMVKPIEVEFKTKIVVDNLDEKVVKLDNFEVVAPQEFIEPEVLLQKNLEQVVKKEEVVVEDKNNIDVGVGEVVVSKGIKNIEVVDLDVKENKKTSTQKMISNDFELVKMLNSDDVIAVKSVDVDDFSKIANDNTIAEAKPSKEALVEEVMGNLEEIADIDIDVDTAFISDDSVDVDSLMTSTPIVSDVKKFDNIIDEKISIKDAFKGMSKEAVEQVRVNITKSAIQGLSKIDIHLKPEGLGMVEIKLNIGKDGKMQANIIASRVETMEVLQKDSVVLAKSLSDAGFDMSSDDFNFSFANKDDGDSRKGLKEFISKTLREDVEIANYEKEFINSSAVNIRV